MTIRLDPEKAHLLKLIAEADGRRLNDEITVAVDALIEDRMKQLDFKQHVQARVDELRAEQQRLERLIAGT